MSAGLDRADEGGRRMNDQIPGDGDFNAQDGRSFAQRGWEAIFALGFKIFDPENKI